MANNKVVLGNETLIDLTGDTVDAAHLASGYTAHNSAGEAVIGAMESDAFYVSCFLDLQTMSISNVDKTYAEIISAYQQGKIIKSKATYYIAVNRTQTAFGDLRIVDTVAGYATFDVLMMADFSGSGTESVYYLYFVIHSNGNVTRGMYQLNATQII